LPALTKLLLARLDEDYDRPGLVETPERVAKAWGFWTSGWDGDPVAILKTFEDGAENYDEMVFQGRIPVYSHCEHHLAPFFGVAHIGYIPDGKIVGLSKLSRVTDLYARRLQVQERLTNQICEAIWEVLDPIGCGVVLRCRHMCMESRGIQRGRDGHVYKRIARGNQGSWWRPSGIPQVRRARRLKDYKI
jgi:GTP cyclohydrolase I